MMINRKIILRVSKLLNLAADGNEQDWSIEFADKSRITEFIKIISSMALSPSERYALVSLILASYDDYLLNEIDKADTLWNQIIKVLDNNRGKYDELLNYWALWGEENKENWFNITFLTRNYLSKNK